MLGAVGQPRADDGPINSWRETGALSAPEATQGAVADERFVYAIANRLAAKYDRRSGERLAISNGDVHHLNSGFLWKGRVYCAHSNYPQQPPRSQIKVLDPESMRLEDYHDFAELAGSLTWAVHHNDAWWCNFARYAADNASTVLVRFNDTWHETGRWKYPREVLAQLGQMSISGGVWRDEYLCVTDHDTRVIYRLRLPRTGKTLEYVDQQASPFAGQGIANDPLTGGLVGIERANRRVVFARLEEPALERGAGRPLRLRVLTYNIHHGEGTDGKLDLQRIARVISEVAPDVVALQEVDQGVDRTLQVDQPAEMSRLCGLQAVFGANLNFQGGRYGNAVLSRLPIRQQRNHLLPSLEGGEQRGVLEVLIELPGSSGLLRLTATHLDARAGDDERLASADAINALVSHETEQPALLLGDLNATPESAVLARFQRVWMSVSREPKLTSPASLPRRQLDYVLFAPAQRWRVIETRVLDESIASDHRPLLAVLDWLPAVK